MCNLTGWSRFLARQLSSAPLRYVHGMRGPVEVGIDCGVHFHAEFEIVYHPTGRGVTMVEGRRLEFSEGSVVIYAPGEPHNQAMAENGEDLCVQLAPPKSGGGGSKGTALPEGAICLPRVENRALREDLHLLSRGFPGLNKTKQAIYDLRATAVLLELIQTACARRTHEEADPAEQHVLKAEQFIRERFAKIRSVEEIAAHLGVSHDHLRHVFKTRRGKPLVRHLNEVRVERAGTLLRHSGLPMKQIAALCGFKDEYYFSAVFKKLTGSAPGDCRREG